MDNNKKQKIIRFINLIWEIISWFCVLYIVGVITISLVNIERNLTFLTKINVLEKAPCLYKDIKW